MKKRSVSSGAVSKPGLALLQVQEAAHEQRRADEQDERHRDFEDDEAVAQPRAASALSGAAGAVAQRFLQIQPAGLQRRRQSEDESGQRPTPQSCRRCRAALISQ